MSSEHDVPYQDGWWVKDFDPRALQARLEQVLAGLATRLTSSGPAAALGPELLSGLLGELTEIRAHAAGRLRVVIMGDFKRGKSTLVNALLGQPIAPVDVLPETVTINEFTYGERLSVCLRLEGGGRVSMDRSDLASSRLRPLIENAGDTVTHVEVRAPIPMLQGMILVDTPGTGDLRADLEAAVRRYLAEADVIVAVLAADAPLSQTEEALLRTAVAPHEFSRIAIVLNMIDRISDSEDATRVEARVRAKIGRVFPGARVYPLSALHEFARLTKGEPEASDARLAAMFSLFRRDLGELVATRAEALLLDRSMWMAERALADSAGRIRLLQQGMAHRTDELDDMLAKLVGGAASDEQALTGRRQELGRRVGALGEAAAAWMAGFVDRLAAELPRQLANCDSRDVERDFPFFLQDMLRDALSACLEYHGPELEQIAKAALADDSGSALLRSPQQGGELAVQMGDVSARSELAILEQLLGAVVGAVPAGLLFALADITRERSRRDSQRQALAQRLAASTPVLRDKAKEMAERAYAELSQRLRQQLDTARAQMRTTQAAALQRARTVKDEAAADAQATGQGLEAALKAIAAARRELEQLRVKVGSSELLAKPEREAAARA